MYLLSLQAAEIYDQLIFNALNAGTSVYFPGGATSNATTTASNTIAYADLVSLDALLNDAGGRPMDSGDYVLVCASQVYASLLKDPDWLN
jgi:N4-gp56 family major capsid protein